MSVLEKAKKRIFLLADLGREFPWKKARAAHSRDADLVMWVHHSYPSSWLKYLLRDDGILKDAGLIAGLADAGVPFRLVTGRGIDKVRDSPVVYSISPYNPNRRRNYSAGLMEALGSIEARGNTLNPTAAEAEWWENKVYMHQRFDELGVNTPSTIVDRPAGDLHLDGLDFPLLVKEPHSAGSAGLHKVSSPEELRRLRAEFRAAGEPEVLVQELLDMNRDLRVTLVGDEIVHHYFRINTGPEWQPTSTRRGSVVDFETFPEQWRDHIVEVFGRLGMRTGAFDVCWVGDDLEGEPIFLEVSPAYSPNPPPPAAFADRPYHEFKKQLTGPDAFGRAFVRLVFRIQSLVLAEWGITTPR